MKWIWISTGIALIVAITVICCFMICNGRYVCNNIVWALYALLSAHFIVGGCLTMKKVKRNATEETMLLQLKENETKQNLFVTEVTKDIIDLRNQQTGIKEEMEKYKELRNIVIP